MWKAVWFGIDPSADRTADMKVTFRAATKGHFNKKFFFKINKKQRQKILHHKTLALATLTNKA